MSRAIKKVEDLLGISVKDRLVGKTFTFIQLTKTPMFMNLTIKRVTDEQVFTTPCNYGFVARTISKMLDNATIKAKRETKALLLEWAKEVKK